MTLKTYKVKTPFLWRKDWTTNGQELKLLDCEAAQLHRSGRIEKIIATVPAPNNDEGGTN